MPHLTQAFRDRLAEETRLRPMMIRVLRELPPHSVKSGFEALVDDELRDCYSEQQLASIEASGQSQVVWEIPTPPTYLTELTERRSSPNILIEFSIAPSKAPTDPTAP
ncbi:MAG: hypothetical protein WKG01_27325 [Kofleriaceae bacterium]